MRPRRSELRRLGQQSDRLVEIALRPSGTSCLMEPSGVRVVHSAVSNLIPNRSARRRQVLRCEGPSLRVGKNNVHATVCLVALPNLAPADLLEVLEIRFDSFGVAHFSTQLERFMRDTSSFRCISRFPERDTQPPQRPGANGIS